jgi:hypothetical protein
MGPKPQTPQSGDLFRFPLAEHLNPKHELVLLGDAMDWSEIERSFSAHFASTTGRPALPPRLVAGLLYLQHSYDLRRPPKTRTSCMRCMQRKSSASRKARARTPYEFGVKVTVATTLKEGFVVGMRSMPGNPYDGHTLEEAIEQVSILAEQTPKIVIVDTRAQNSRAFESCDQDRSAALAERCTR